MSYKAPKDQEQRTAEAEVEEFKQDLGPFVVAAETTRMAMVFTDASQAESPIIFANDSFLKLTGYDRDEMLAKSFHFLIADEGDDDSLARAKSAFDRAPAETHELHFRRKNGSEFWATLFVSPVTDEEGTLVQHFLSLVETTKYKNAQRHAAMLIDELNHRVKNTLATVQSIVTQAVRNSKDPLIVRESIETRIAALSRSHDLLARDKWEGAGLRDLVDEALAPFRVADGRAERFTVEGENIRLSPKATLALGIAFNELATNAVKYGAFSNEAGKISVTWKIVSKDNRWLCLQWRETGGPAVKPPSRKGFGSRVIERGLAHELNGRVEVDYAPTGLVCTIEVPVRQAVIDG